MIENGPQIPKDVYLELEAQTLSREEKKARRMAVRSAFRHGYVTPHQFSRSMDLYGLNFGDELLKLERRLHIRKKFANMSLDELIQSVEPECQKAERLIVSAEQLRLRISNST